jgi:NAD(P)-dependent dehydrogenase (short-subunit alcohol dehydrogenase family)/CMP-N-acetylneuraminic acid synthetase
MSENGKVFAFIPIRHDSQRLPGKNYRLLGKKPLYRYIIDTLLQVSEISAIIIDTDSPIVKTGCQDLSPKLVILDRDKTLTGPDISTNALIKNLLYRTGLPEYPCLEGLLNPNSVILQTHVTNPFLLRETVETAVQQFKSMLTNKACDSMLSVTKLRTRLYDPERNPINHDPSLLIQTQDLKPVYEDNSLFYLFTRKSFEDNSFNRLGKKPYFYIMEKNSAETIDIDWAVDFELAEAYLLMDHKKHKQQEKRRTVLITGASGGIGHATAKHFKAKGWTVIGTDLYEREQKLVPEGKADNEETKCYDLFIPADLCLPSDLQRLHQTFVLNYGNQGLDALVNVAATQECGSIQDAKSEMWDTVMTTNLKSPYFLIRDFLPQLQKKKGCIVNVSSIHALQTSSNICCYAVSKAGLSGLTRNLAIELAKYGIRVNSVCPGAIDTEMLRAGLFRDLGVDLNKEAEDKKMQTLKAKHLLGDIGKPMDIAQAIYFLADNKKSAFITGSNLVVDGGATIRLSTE